MSLDQVPLVTQLLRACRDGNEPLLKEVFKNILANKGITREELNVSDKSGRTALSYICAISSAGLHKYLELMLDLPGIDVNKADNEGNTPLHFAAQAGQTDAVNLLLRHNVIVDAKNNLGFTPLMKAALQGRTKCAKLLLFAGASPIEVDRGRSYRPEQWARFCGRHTTAETIEIFARQKLMSQTTSKWSYDNLDLAPKSSLIDGAEGEKVSNFRSKFKKVFPFKFYSTKQKSAGNNGRWQKENGTDEQLGVDRVNDPQVPKLEVTYANNNALIKKYKLIYGDDSVEEGGNSNRIDHKTLLKRSLKETLM